ncbi:14379_t:CDS:2, partial [Cetraspora pellucida]
SRCFPIFMSHDVQYQCAIPKDAQNLLPKVILFLFTSLKDGLKDGLKGILKGDLKDILKGDLKDSQICVGFLVGSSLLVAFLGTAGMTLICLYYRREKVSDGSQSDKEKNKPSPVNLLHYPDQQLHLSPPPSPNTFSNYLQSNNIVHLPFTNTVMMSPATESCGDSWDNHIAYITKISERLHCDLDEKQVSLFTKQTHESESLA